MGQKYFCCLSGEPENKRNREIDRNLRYIKIKDVAEKKLLLLGAGGSGKSTLFRQLKILDKGMSERERRSFKDTIYTNIIEAIQTLVWKNQEFYNKEEKHFELGPEAQLSAAAVLDLIDDQVTPALAHHINLLWADEAIQRTWRRRSGFQIQHSSKYYFENINRIAEASTTPLGYIPTEDDITRCRARTTGIVEQVFRIQGKYLRILDVGGQRNERCKWIHCFEGVDGVIFVCALSGYDQKIFEDDETNRMQESLLLFKSILRSGWFVDSSVILFLNKKDLFAEKIGRTHSENPLKVPLSACFPDCPKHEDPYKDGIKYIRDQFMKRLGNRDRSDLYVHVTCATDKGNIKKVFDDVHHQLIKKAMQKAVLL